MKAPWDGRLFRQDEKFSERWGGRLEKKEEGQGHNQTRIGLTLSLGEVMSIAYFILTKK
jgi:hypothetical protein